MDLRHEIYINNEAYDEAYIHYYIYGYFPETRTGIYINDQDDRFVKGFKFYEGSSKKTPFRMILNNFIAKYTMMSQ